MAKVFKMILKFIFVTLILGLLIWIGHSLYKWIKGRLGK
jgi:hypothetical protein